MNFTSDNTAGASPEILQAIIDANEGNFSSYGDDPITKQVQKQINDLFETETTIFMVPTGTAANSLALSVLTPSWGTVLCHKRSHIQVDECGAPEFYTGGARLHDLDGKNGKLYPSELIAAAAEGGGDVHHMQPHAISITQVTEMGTIYSVDEVKAISKICKDNGLKLHMDGARFANAVDKLGCTPAEITWKAGVDILCFGATKNGALVAECVILFDKSLAEEFSFRRKRGGHLFSKMRIMSSQMQAYLTNDLWLTNAAHANKMATRLADGLEKIPKVKLEFPLQSNMMFIQMPQNVIDAVIADGFKFYQFGNDPIIRLVTAFNTDPADVDALVASVKKHTGS